MEQPSKDLATAIEAQERASASVATDTLGASPTTELNRKQRRAALSRVGALGGSQPQAIGAAANLGQQLQAQRHLLEQVVSSNQLLSKLLYGFLEKEMTITPTAGPDGTTMAILTIPPGLEIRDEVLSAIAEFIKAPIIVLPHGSSLETADEKMMRKNGWIKGGLVDGQGNPL